MSNKTKEVTQRAGVLVVGPRSGKSLTRAVWEMWGEFDSPPATPEEAEAFCRIHIKRCNMNLANAKDRGDKRAVINLERKLAVYEYLYKLAKDKAAEIKSTTECPNCRVHAVGTDGVCACCGKSTKLRTPFAKIVVSGKASKPYFEILYYDPADKQYHLGWGSYLLDYVFKWLGEEFEITDEEANSWLLFPGLPED